MADAISSDLKDLDGDSYIEFGGCDLTEKHPSEDSMYYIPYDYYEIKKGNISYDSVFSKKMDRKINGVYLSQPVDPAGNCCKVVVIPGVKKVRLVNPRIVSERIDGPANVRDKVDGRRMFVLNDNVPVSTSDTVKGWLQIGLIVDLTDTQFADQKITKGASLFVAGNVVGTAIEDLKVDGRFRDRGKGKAILWGYTMLQNIRLPTMPENVLAKLIDQPSVENVGMTRLKDFIEGFGFSRTKIGSYVTYQLDEGVALGPSSPLRILLVFNENELFAVVHRRKLPLADGSAENVGRDYHLSVIASPSQGYTKAFVEKFKDWLSEAD